MTFATQTDNDADDGRHPGGGDACEPGIELGSVLNGTFRILGMIAQGGMGRLYLASHERLPGLFVVKTPHTDVPDAADIAARLRLEATVVAGLSHPNIVKVFDLNQTPNGTPYIVMEHLQGMDLSRILRTRSLRPWQAAAVVRQVASALSAAHACGVVHCDLKPENVFLVSVAGQEDMVKLIDFGASRLHHIHRLTADPRELVGTPSYMSPEQVQGKPPQVDARSDQFALAIMTYEMLAGVAPFVADDPLRLLYRIVNNAVPPLAEQVSWRPAEVERVLCRALEKNPNARFRTVADFSRALDAALLDDIGGPMEPLQLLAGAQPAAGAADTNAVAASPAGARPRARSEARTETIEPERPRQKLRGGRHRASRAPSAARASTGARPIRQAQLRRRQRGLRLLTAAVVAVLVGLLAPDAFSVIADLRAEVASRVEHLVLQTRAMGPSSTAALPGIFQPRYRSETPSWRR